MLYERKLGHVPKGWGMHERKFFYQENDEEDDSFEIFMLELDKENKMHICKLSLPVMFKQQQIDAQAAEDPKKTFKLVADTKTTEEKQRQDQNSDE